MTEMEKMKAGLEYSYADEELEARKTQAYCGVKNTMPSTAGILQYNTPILRRCLAVLVKGYG